MLPGKKLIILILYRFNNNNFIKRNFMQKEAISFFIKVATLTHLHKLDSGFKPQTGKLNNIKSSPIQRPTTGLKVGPHEFGPPAHIFSNRTVNSSTLKISAARAIEICKQKNSFKFPSLFCVHFLLSQSNNGDGVC